MCVVHLRARYSRITETKCLMCISELTTIKNPWSPPTIITPSIDRFPHRLCSVSINRRCFRSNLEDEIKKMNSSGWQWNLFQCTNIRTTQVLIFHFILIPPLVYIRFYTSELPILIMFLFELKFLFWLRVMRQKHSLIDVKSKVIEQSRLHCGNYQQYEGAI